MLDSKFTGHTFCGLADYFKIPHDSILNQWLGEKLFLTVLCIGLDFEGALENVSKVDAGVFHSALASRQIRRRSSQWIDASVTTSTLRPK